MAKKKKNKQKKKRLDPMDSTMSLGDHLEELRARILLALMGLAVGLIVSLIFGNRIVGFIKAPYDNLRPDDPLIVIGVADAFIAYFKISLIAGLILTSPWVFYQLWAFIAAGLYPRERKYVYTSLPFSVSLFVAGAMFFLFIIAPISLGFFLKFGDWLGIQSQWTLQKYVSFVTILMLVFGLGFQTPIAIFILNRTGLVSIATLKSIRKFVFFGAFIASAIATPPDVISQITLALPLYLLFELGIIVSAMAGRKAEKNALREREDDGPDDDDDGGGSPGGGGDGGGSPQTDDGNEPSGVAAAITGDVPDSSDQTEQSPDIEVKPEERSYGEELYNEDNAYIDGESYSEADAREDAGEYGYEGDYSYEYDYGDGGEYDYGDEGDYGVGDPARSDTAPKPCGSDVEETDGETSDDDSQIDVREFEGQPYGYDEQADTEPETADDYAAKQDTADLESKLDVSEYTGPSEDAEQVSESPAAEEKHSDEHESEESDSVEPLEVQEFVGEPYQEDVSDVQEQAPESADQKPLTGEDVDESTADNRRGEAEERDNVEDANAGGIDKTDSSEDRDDEAPRKEPKDKPDSD